METLRLDKVDNRLANVIKPYLKEFIALHGENIRSLNLYGSAAAGGFSFKNSDVNLLAVFNRLNFQDLKKSLKLVSRGINKKISAPLCLTLEHIKSSQDVFPIEFLEIKENYLCLYGEDILKSVDIKKDNLRLFCEEQIKGKLIRLRQAYLEIGLVKKGLEALVKESLNSLKPVFRNMLRLKGVLPSAGREDILADISREFGLEEGVFTAVLRDKRDDEKIAGKDIEVYFEKYLNQILKLAQAADKL